MAAKKTPKKNGNGGSTPKMSDHDKMKALGLTDAEINHLDLQGINFGKLLKFITGFIKLVSDTFGESTTGTGDGGGIFGAQKAPAPKEEVDRLKALGVPKQAALFGGGRLLEIIKFILSLLGGVTGSATKTGADVVTTYER